MHLVIIVGLETEKMDKISMYLNSNSATAAFSVRRWSKTSFAFKFFLYLFQNSELMEFRILVSYSNTLWTINGMYIIVTAVVKNTQLKD